MTTKPRPCWIVLAPKRKGIEKEVRRIYDRDEGGEEACPWEVRPGKADYVAIIEYRPGLHDVGEENLGKKLSRGEKKPVYVMRLDDDAPRVMAFASGKYIGDVSAWPDAVARQLGCTFPQRLGGRGKVDLTARKTPAARRGERKLVGCTIRQWKHLMRYEENWDALLDAATEKDAPAVLAALKRKDADVRMIACKLANGIGVYGFGAKAPDVLAQLRALETSDRSQEVRAAAQEAATHLAEGIEKENARAEFPWMGDYSIKSLPGALAALSALDDERETVRRHVCMWWLFAWEVPADRRAQVEKKLEDLIERESSTEVMASAVSALQNVRAGGSWGRG